jgi:hypothetical protein
MSVASVPALQYIRAVGFYDWILSLHLLAAFAVASALVLYSVLVFSGRRMTTLEQTRPLFRVAPIGTVLIIAGALGTIVFGVILSLDSGYRDFHIWDPWIIAGIVLWVVLTGIGQRSGAYYSDVEKLSKSSDSGTEAAVLDRLKASTGTNLHLATVAVFLLIVLDMLFKPGA